MEFQNFKGTNYLISDIGEEKAREIFKESLLMHQLDSVKEGIETMEEFIKEHDISFDKYKALRDSKNEYEYIRNIYGLKTKVDITKESIKTTVTKEIISDISKKAENITNNVKEKLDEKTEGFRLRIQYFKERIEKSFNNIISSLKKAVTLNFGITKKYSDEEIKKLTFVKDAILNDNTYSANHYREIYPIVERADKTIAEAVVEKNAEKIKENLSGLYEKLIDVERKKNELGAVLEKALNSPNADEYVLFKNNYTKELQLVNKNYDLNNRYKKENGILGEHYPAVINIDLVTNEVSVFDTVKDMENSSIGYRSLKMENATYMEQYLSLGNRFENDSNAPMHIKKSVYKNLENQAEYYASIYEKLYKNSNPVYDYAKQMAENMKLFVTDFTKQIIIPSTQNENSAIVLSYSNEGLSQAFFWDGTGKSQKVFDINGEYLGFMYIDNPIYKELLESAELNSLLEIEGVEISKDTEEKFFRNAPLVFGYLGQKEYRMVDVGWSEPENFGYEYKSCFTKKLEKMMLEKADAMQEAVGKLAVVSYNCYNNSINFEMNNQVLTITYNDSGNQLDVFMKKEGARLKDKDCIVLCGKVLDKEKTKTNLYNLVSTNIGVPVNETKQKEHEK